MILRNVSDTGNIFLTNIQSFEGDVKDSSVDDEDTSAYFLGDKPVTKTSDSTVDLGMIGEILTNLL